MKKIYISFFVSFFLSLSLLHAQVNKGSTLLGGNIGFNTQHMQNVDNNTWQKQQGFSFAPVFGKAVKDNLILGGDLIFSYSKSESGQGLSNYLSKDYNYGAGIFLRQYKPIGKGFNLFLQGRLGAYYLKNNVDPNLAYNSYKRIGAGLSAYPGISYAVSKKFHLETGFDNLLYVNYSNEKGDRLNGSGTKYETNSFNIGSSITNFSSLYVGFRVLLGK